MNINLNIWGLFKKSPQTIFVCETNSDAPAVTIACRDPFSVGFFFIPPWCRKGDSELVPLKKIAYSDFLKRPNIF